MHPEARTFLIRPARGQRPEDSPASPSRGARAPWARVPECRLVLAPMHSAAPRAQTEAVQASGPSHTHAHTPPATRTRTDAPRARRHTCPRLKIRLVGSCGVERTVG